MFLRQDTLSVLKVALAIGALFGAASIYDSSQERQNLVDRCVQLMIFQAAKFDGYWVEKDELNSRRTDGRLVVMAFANKPIQWGDLGTDPTNNSSYMIRCTVHQNGIMSSLVVEKMTPANVWEFVDPNTLQKIEESIEVLESRKEPAEN